MLSKGDRVQLSEAAKRAGIYRSSGTQERRGTVIRIGRCVSVHWDGLSARSEQHYHPDYIAPIVDQQVGNK